LKRWSILGVIVLSTFALSATYMGDSDAEHSKQVKVSTSGVELAPQTDFVDYEEAAAIEVEVQAYLEAVYQEQLQQFYAGVQAELDRQAERARQAQRYQAPNTYHPGSTVGECTGFAIPDYIIQRESGGNPSAYNPSGAYGCAQTLLSHYSSGSCRGLDPYTIEGQRQCVLILSNGGTNLNPWAQTR